MLLAVVVVMVPFRVASVVAADTSSRALSVAYKGPPRLRIIGPDETSGGNDKRSTDGRPRGSTQTVTVPAHFDAQVQPAAAESRGTGDYEVDFYSDESITAESITGESITGESIRVDSQTGDYVGGAMDDRPSADEYDYAPEHEGAAYGDGVGAGFDEPCPECGQYHGPGVHGAGNVPGNRFRPIEHMIAKSWDHDTVGESWLTRPYYIGGFIGAMFGDQLISNEIDLTEGFFGGVRVGWDFSTTWSAEARLGSSAMPVKIVGREARDNTDVLVGDIDLLWMPWGDTPWRPYVLFGFGFSNFQFRGLENYNYDKTVFGIPWGIGFRHRWTPRWACRLELLDNVAFGGSEQIDTMHNITLSGGVEFRFGGANRTYWPWDPGRDHW
ncbi:MAG: outer membrane beta-barrel protein [Planctomycetales bacterium]|nr:outer membrane beta-barrel protein [Planctomycetales bacterium]